MRVGTEPSSVDVLTFPAKDAVFAERVREIVDETSSADPQEVTETLASRLRLVHPNVSIRPRTESAGYGQPVIYAFRDGTALSSFAADDWINEAGVARVVTDATGRYIEANASAAELFGVEQDQMVGRPAGVFTAPDTRVADPEALWRSLQATGRLHSLGIIRRPAGDRAIEFVTIREGDGPGRHVTVLRAIEA